ncbi:MAG: Peptidyl-tRNA hydrolase [Fimbriimonadaceae bacterium]|nr:Peptidyl-tRNA hydrolase [Fimbriimonadaceae bacterium]
MFRRRPRPTVQPEWLVVGLGNPGPEYRGTRHNVGFETIEKLAEKHHIKLDQRKFQAVYGVGEALGIPIAIAKPLTFMNLSGRAVLPLMQSFGLRPERVLVVADDLDLPLGVLRFRDSGNPGGHNGHKSLINTLGTNSYPRFKIGIGKDDIVIDHVLGRFDSEERTLVDKVINIAIDRIGVVLQQGVAAAMVQASIRVTD